MFYFNSNTLIGTLESFSFTQLRGLLCFPVTYFARSSFLYIFVWPESWESNHKLRWIFDAYGDKVLMGVDQHSSTSHRRLPLLDISINGRPKPKTLVLRGKTHASLLLRGDKVTSSKCIQSLWSLIYCVFNYLLILLSISTKSSLFGYLTLGGKNPFHVNFYSKNLPEARHIMKNMKAVLFGDRRYKNWTHPRVTTSGKWGCQRAICLWARRWGPTLPSFGCCFSPSTEDSIWYMSYLEFSHGWGDAIQGRKK
jgi:hypothetical protein